MPQPTPYVPNRDYTQDETNFLAGRSTVLTAGIDAEFSDIQTTLDGVLANLAVIQRDDGKLGDYIVKSHTLDPAVVALISNASTWNIRGAWVTATAYAVFDLVTYDDATYVCISAHTSGTFSTDFSTNNYWALLGGYPDGGVIHVDHINGRVGVGRVPTADALEVEGSASIRGAGLGVGVADTQAGTAHLYGHAAASDQGGRCRYYLAADHDTTIDYIDIEAWQDDIRISPSTSAWNHYLRADGSVEFAGKVSFAGDTNFWLDKTSGIYPKLNFDVNDYLVYDTLNDAVGIQINGADRHNFYSDHYEINAGGTGNRSAYIDFHGDDTYTDYGLRVIRNNTGPNANSDITHRGTGSLQLLCSDAGQVDFLTSNTLRGYFAADGGFVVGSPTGASKGAGTGNFENGLYVDGSRNTRTVILDSPELITASPVTSLWTTVDNATLNSAQAVAAILKAEVLTDSGSAATTDAAQADMYFRKTGSALGAAAQTRVAYSNAQCSVVGQSISDADNSTTIVALDGSYDFDYYFTKATVGGGSGGATIYLVGYIVLA